MKRTKLLLLLLVAWLPAAFSQIQHIKIVSFVVKNQLPSVIDNWNNLPGSLLLVAQKGPNARVEGVRLVLQIKAAGAIICGANVSNGLPVENNFTTRTFSVGELTGLLASCHELKEGSYMLCAQFFNIDKVPISEEVCKPFNVEVPKETDYSPPVLITPENGKEFSMSDMQKPVIFRWTPVVPKPREPVTYRLRVWQLMQGQNGTQAMRSNQPIVTKDADNITQAVVNNLVTGPCRPPYLCDFIWQVQALNKEGKPIGRNSGNSEPYSFKVKDAETNATISNVYPENNKHLTPEQAKAVINFRWTPVNPRPSGPVVYRLKVWQLMQGQNGAQAMEANQPIVTKEVNNLTQADVAGILRSGCTSGPCCPPYLCDFIWRVEALTPNAAGQAQQVIAGSSPTMFMVSQYIIQIDSIKVSCTDKPGVYTFSYTITNPNPGTAKLTNFAITSSTPAGASLGSFAPPLNTNIPSNNQLTITGTINGPSSLSNICIGAEITDLVNSFWKASKDTCADILPCKCTACDSAKIEINPKEIKPDANGNISINANISAGPKPVKSVKAELVYYEYKPESDDCMLCNKDSKTYGNIDNGTLGNAAGNGGGTHSLEWLFSPDKNLSGGSPLALTITVPPTVKCCNAVIRWCIRYVITFSDCTVCNKLVCSEIKKEGCAKGNSNPNTDQK